MTSKAIIPGLLVKGPEIISTPHGPYIGGMEIEGGIVIAEYCRRTLVLGKYAGELPHFDRIRPDYCPVVVDTLPGLPFWSTLWSSGARQKRRELAAMRRDVADAFLQRGYPGPVNFYEP